MPSQPKNRTVIRRRTGCMNCRNRRKKCDETTPECLACVRRGIPCGGYNRLIVFKDVSEKAAESSRKFEAARWAELRRADKAKEQARKPDEQTLSAASSSDDNIGTDGDQPSLHLRPDQETEWTVDSSNIWLDNLDSLPHTAFDIAFDLLDEDSCRGVADPLQFPPEPTHGVSIQPPPGTAMSVPSKENTTALAHMSLSGLSSTCSMTMSRPPSLSRQRDEALVLYFREQVVPKLPVDIDFASIFSGSSCFRAAALALSACMEQRQSMVTEMHDLRCRDDKDYGGVYYRSAVRKLEEALGQPDGGNKEQLLSTYLLLAYHDMEADSPQGVRHYASCVDAMASEMEAEVYMTPGLFKAWRMLRSEKRFLSLPTRATTSMTDAWEGCSSFDHQLAIKDIMISAWRLHSRYAMEASFPSSNAASASEQAVRWLCLVLNRECDRKQAEQGDFHTKDLTVDDIIRQCDGYDQQLDHWHCMVPEGDIPVPKLRSCADIITGSSFEPLITYRLLDEDKAISYVIYLIARMTCSHLRSMVDPSCTASVTETLGRIALGIIHGMNLRYWRFSALRLHALLLMIVLLAEGITLATIVLDSMIPRVTSQTLPLAEAMVWKDLQGVIELVVSERLRGKAIRVVIDGSDGTHRPNRLMQPHVLVVFGDYHGKGHFRQVYRV